MGEVCGIIAGAGAFPLHVAQEAKRQGFTVVGIGLKDWADPSLTRHVDVYEEIPVGQLGKLIRCLKTHHVRQVIMAGKITKDVLFDARVAFDLDALAILGKVRDFSVNGLLGAIGEKLTQQGVTLLDSSTFLKQDLCPVGVLTTRQPTPVEREDVRVGVRAARKLAELDVGQTVLVKERVIVAVEALEGTDAAITRAGALANGGLVLVKMASATQDMRFDLPILGPQTIAMARQAGVTCVAVEAHKTLLLDRAQLLAHANEAKISLLGVDPNTDNS